MPDRSAAIRRTVKDLITVEGSIAKLLDRFRPVVGAHPATTQYFEDLAQMVELQRETLATHLKALPGSDIPLPRTSTVPWIAEIGDGSIARALQTTYAALNYAAASYAAAFEVALRLYDPPLRKIAPEHLKSYANGTQRLERLLTSIVAWELLQAGLECHCVCPMCGIGACGCVAFGAATLLKVRPQLATVADTAAGFPLQRPRAGCQLAQAGVQEGDRLIAVDGVPVSRTPEIQAAIRMHRLGEEVHLTIRRDSGDPREIVMRHVSDYPTVIMPVPSPSPTISLK